MPAPAQVTRDAEVQYSETPTVSKQIVNALYQKHHTPPYSQSDTPESAIAGAKEFFSGVLPDFKVPEDKAFIVWMWEDDFACYTAGISFDFYHGWHFSIGKI